jgi:Uma2 family endonuclease
MLLAQIRLSLVKGILIDLLNHVINTGLAFPECAIQTADNIKVADVVWVSNQRLAIIENQIAASIAPEICIEIISINHTIEEIKQKLDLYLEAEAKEVWLCDEDGNIRFYNQNGEVENSSLFPLFPHRF